MKVKIFILIFGLGAVFMSCEPVEEKISRDRNATLTFSTDTVIFDTLLSSVGSITKRLRIYNPNENAIEVTSLRLGKLESSEYTITINGQEGKSFNDEVIFGNDSITILVTALINPQDENLPYLVKDSLVVESNGNEWDVKLVAYGQDAFFINRGVFNCDVTLTADRPYVIYGFALVDTSCVLRIEPGTRVLFDNEAFLAVAGTLLVEGDTANPVILRNARLDEKFSNVPGQWLGVFFQEGSSGNSINHAVISNSQIGLSIGNPENEDMIDLELQNTIIENMSFAGLFSVNADITAVNNVIYNCGTYMVANLGGGDYTYYHNTFVNTPNSFIREDPSIQIADWVPISETQAIANDLQVTMVNNIVWGDVREELLIAESSNVVGYQIDVRNNIIRSNDEAWVNMDNFISNDRNFPGFINVNNQNYQLDTLSFSQNRGLAIGIQTDILEIIRDEQPDIGAYERIDKE